MITTVVSYVESIWMRSGLRTREITLESAKGTVVVVEVDRVRERRAGEPVHLRATEDDPICAECGERATVWYGSGAAERERWAKHPCRCMPEEG